jgi:hypothetical protein
MARGDGYDQLLSIWGIQESLLQAYRSIFITAESVVFAIAAAITSINSWSAIALTVLGLVLLWMWHKVCWNRAIDVSFVQWLLTRVEEGADITNPLSTFKEFQGGGIITVGGRSVWRHAKKDQGGRVNDQPFVSMTKSPTRHWMEKYLPMVFLLLWISVAYLAVRALCSPNPL